MSFSITNGAMLAGVVEALQQQVESKDKLLEGYRMSLFDYIALKPEYEKTRLEEVKNFIETEILNFNQTKGDNLDQLVNTLTIGRSCNQHYEALQIYRWGFDLSLCKDPDKRASLNKFLDSLRYYNDDD